MTNKATEIMLDSRERPTRMLRLWQIRLVWTGLPWPALSYVKDLCWGTSKLSVGRSVINSAWRCYLSLAWADPFEKEAFLYPLHSLCSFKQANQRTHYTVKCRSQTSLLVYWEGIRQAVQKYEVTAVFWKDVWVSSSSDQTHWNIRRSFSLVLCYGERQKNKTYKWTSSHMQCFTLYLWRCCVEGATFLNKLEFSSHVWHRTHLNSITRSACVCEKRQLHGVCWLMLPGCVCFAGITKLIPVLPLFMWRAHVLPLASCHAVNKI